MTIAAVSKRLLLPALAAAGLAAAAPARAAAEVTEAEVKAAFIYNFTRFVEWEGLAASTAPGHFDICALGEDAVNASLSALPAAEVLGKKIRVRLLKDSEEDLPSCRILFIGRSKKNRAAEIAGGLRKAGVLTVSGAPRFARSGGIMGFVLENKRVKIEVNLKAAREAGLKISSRLLEVSRLVHDQP